MLPRADPHLPSGPHQSRSCMHPFPLSPQASIRATAWRAFLDISVRRMKHYYRDLVEQV